MALRVFSSGLCKMEAGSQAQEIYSTAKRGRSIGIVEALRQPSAGTVASWIAKSINIYMLEGAYLRDPQ